MSCGVLEFRWACRRWASVEISEAEVRLNAQTVYAPRFIVT